MAAQPRKRARTPRPATPADEADIGAIFADAFAKYMPRLGPAAVPDTLGLLKSIEAREVFVIDGELDAARWSGRRGFGSRVWPRPVRWTAKASPRAVSGVGRPASNDEPAPPIGPVATITLKVRGRTLMIFDLAVHPRHQHQGLGRTLLMFAEMRCYRLGLSRIEITTSSAMWETQALYARLGFEELDVFEADGIECVQYFKRLGPDRRRRN